jgi:hypothetical protein
VTAARNERPGHPPWCVKDSKSTVGRHVSVVLKFGARRQGGQATIWLTGSNTGPVRVHLSVAQMAWAAIDMPPADAAALRDGLTELLRQAGHE